MPKLGDTVTVIGVYHRNRDDKDNVTWHENTCQQWTGVFVGWARVQEGVVRAARTSFASGSSWEPAEPEYDAPYLQVTSTVKVAKVQPLDNGQRYRNPVLCSIQE